MAKVIVLHARASSRDQSGGKPPHSKVRFSFLVQFFFIHVCLFTLHAESTRLAVVKEAGVYFLEGDLKTPRLVIQADSPHRYPIVASFSADGSLMFYSVVTDESLAWIKQEIMQGRDGRGVEGYERSWLVHDIKSGTSTEKFRRYSYGDEFVMSPDGHSFIEYSCDDASCDCCTLHPKKTASSQPLKIDGVRSESIAPPQAVWHHDSQGVFYWKFVREGPQSGDPSDVLSPSVVALNHLELASGRDSKVCVATGPFCKNLFVSSLGHILFESDAHQLEAQEFVRIVPTDKSPWRVERIKRPEYQYLGGTFIPTNDTEHYYLEDQQRVHRIHAETWELSAGYWSIPPNCRILAVDVDSSGRFLCYLRRWDASENMSRSTVIQDSESPDSPTIHQDFRLDAVWVPVFSKSQEPQNGLKAP